MRHSGRGQTSRPVERRNLRTRVGGTWTAAERERFIAEFRAARHDACAVTIQAGDTVRSESQHSSSNDHDRTVADVEHADSRRIAPRRTLPQHGGGAQVDLTTVNRASLGERRAAGRRNSRSPAAFTAPTVLVADADVKTRALCARSFRAAGWRVDQAADGRDALVKALGAPPQVVVARIHLPLIDGCSLSQLLRRDQQTARVPIVAITDRAEAAAARTRAAAAGADAVLALPLLPDQLIDVSYSLLRGTLRPHRTAAAPAARPAHNRAPYRRSMRSRQRTRFRTTSPPHEPRAMHCPICKAALKYTYSYVGGVDARRPEQWDVLVCVGDAKCGTFEYRHRTQTLRRLP